MGALLQSDLPEDRAPALRIGALRFRLHHAFGGLPPELPDAAALAASIEAVLADTLDPPDPSYWVVRRLDLPFRAEAALGPGGLAEEFARALRQAVRRILAGEIVEGVRRYDSRAHWLADCLWAQAGGTAAQLWQFGRYRHNAALPPGDAARLTLASERAGAPAALAILAGAARIRPFCDRIGDGAARAILRVLLPADTGPAARLDARLARMVAEERAAPPRGRYAPLLAALARYLLGDPARPLPGLATLLRHGALAGAAGGPAPGFAPVTATPLPSPAIPRANPGTERPGTAPGPLPAAPDPPGRGHPASAPAVIETGFAGVFALWRSVIEMDLLALLPEGEDGGPARLALAAALAGPGHAAAWADPALHWLCGHRPGTAEAPPAPPPDLSRRFPAHYAARRFPQPVETTLSRAGRVSLLQDRATEDWLALGDRRTCRAAAARIGGSPAAPPPGARDPARDLGWFGVAHRRARRGWALLARAAYGDFARRLNGLQGASASWAWDKLLAGWGVLEPGAPAIMTLPRVQLDLVLRMGGLDGTVIDTPGGSVRLMLPGAG